MSRETETSVVNAHFTATNKDDCETLFLPLAEKVCTYSTQHRQRNRFVGQTICTSFAQTVSCLLAMVEAFHPSFAAHTSEDVARRRDTADTVPVALETAVSSFARRRTTERDARDTARDTATLLFGQIEPFFHRTFAKSSVET